MAAFSAFRAALRRVLREAARPAREDTGGEGLMVEPYRGYGNRRELYLMGRVYRQLGGPAGGEAGTRDLLALLQRLLRRGAPEQTLVARFGDAQQQVVTDRDGYFHVHLELAEPPPEDALWHPVALTLRLPSDDEVTATGEVFVPPERARFVVISDIDDTVMYTGVANKVKMLWRLFAQKAENRAAFPGVAALYRALHGADENPVLYVSRGPWTIYSMLQAFFQMHRIPVGPVLFLRDWGITPRSPLPRRSEGHKLELIRAMLTVYRDLPFVLIGDSGQHDPETYAQVVGEHPGRVKAIYIRNVSKDPARQRAIEALAKQVVEADSSLLLASDSVAMAEHAAQIGLVPADTPERVADERRAGTGRRHPHPLRVMRKGSRRETRDAVARGELGQALEEGDDEPANALVEPEPHRHRD